MADRILSDLIGTIRAYFKIATVRLKDSSGVLEVKNSGDTAYANANAHTLGIAGSNASNKVTLTAPAGLGGNVALVLPPAVGTLGYVLSDTDGAGTLGFVAPTSNAATIQVEEFTQATSSPITILAPADDSVITRVIVVVDSAASAGSPTLSVGVAGTAGRDMAATDNNLKAAGIYEVNPMTDVGTDPGDIIATLVPDSQTFSGRVYVEVTVPA
jgi:hypothetical protein